jgi:hypothetical protein
MTIKNCANCDSELQGNFCSNCGQSAKSRRGPIWQISSEFAEDIFSIDSKVFKSLATLLVKPGVLTASFLDGKRASILPPVRLYLVISLLFFFVFQIPTPDFSKDNVYIDEILLGGGEPVKGKRNLTIVQFENSEELSVVEKWLSGFIRDKEAVMKATNPQVTMERLFNKLENLLPNLLILFLPVFALVMKSLYFFKRILYFDHLIFSLHFQTWLMVAVLIIYALALQNPWFATLGILVPIYLARAQKVVYQQSYWLVVPKTILILFIYLILLILGAITAFITSISQL